LRAKGAVGKERVITADKEEIPIILSILLAMITGAILVFLTVILTGINPFRLFWELNTVMKQSERDIMEFQKQIEDSLKRDER
jgi:hypothetical protein